MAFNFSDYLSIIAIIVAIASAYYAKRQSDLSRIALRNDYRAHLSDKHEKYRAALKQVNDKHKKEISHLSEEAGNTLTLIVDTFDQYDIGEHELRYLRHLVHECSEMVYYAFKGQLGWQSGLNMSHRFFQIAQVENRLEPKSNYFNQEESFRSAFKSRYLNDPNAYQEMDLLSDPYFCKLVDQIKTRVDSARRGELLLEVHKIFEPFNTLFNDLKPRINESANDLEVMLEESDLEHFKLHESPQLLERLRYKQATLETLSHLWIHEIKREDADRYSNYVSWCISTCAMLHAIQGFHSWGWKN
ncbi:MAG: hypothetical protein A2063_01565 [Gallionellales bacterium GWA2_60_142]|nr:MAG: hypothetical protein A2063_01565 [Gallionellales bacterium GWA2_60_142]HCI13521.1 hypothetical protein [Gallionellaceae bacterium]